MLVYRLAKEQYIRDLSGTGARLYGGRWNLKGTPMLYTAEHCSLALLELMVHTPHSLLPAEMSLLTLSIPDKLRINTFEKDQLPADWRQYPAPYSLGKMGTRWADEGKAAGLRVPSALIPDEWNILLNPIAGNYQEIRIQSVEPFQIDSRF